MACSMCETHICEIIRKTVPGAKKVSASRRKGEATFLTDEAVDPLPLQAAIGAAGYPCRGTDSAPYVKTGWFQRI